MLNRAAKILKFIPIFMIMAGWLFGGWRAVSYFASLETRIKDAANAIGILPLMGFAQETTSTSTPEAASSTPETAISTPPIATSTAETATSTSETLTSTSQEAAPTPEAAVSASSVPIETVNPAPPAARFDFPIGEIKVLIGDDKRAKIDLATLTFNLPPEAGELEFYAVQDGCQNATLEDIKRNILACPDSRDPIGFSVLRPDDYTWVIDRPMRIVIGACRSKNIDCGDQPEDFLIGFISQELLLPDMSAGAYPVASQ